VSKIIALLLIIVGLINFIPIVGIISAEQLSKLYGVKILNNNLIILLQHRALMFGIIGAFIMYSAFYPALQKFAFIAGFISMLGFIAIAWKSGGYNQELARIVTVDVIAILLLLIAFIFFLFKKT